MICLNNVSKTINGKKVLKDITVSFEEKKMYLIKGHNGCGKSMLLRLLCGLIRADEGEVLGTDNKTFGVIIENPKFMENETALYNMKYLASIQKKIGQKEIEEALSKVNLLEEKGSKVKTYSLGMKQRLSICQAIMENPDVLVLDEPFNALDEENVKRVFDILLEERKKGKIVVVAAHALEEKCVNMFDEVIEMSNGAIIAKEV